MLSEGHRIIGLTLTLITIGEITFACLTSLIILICIIYYLCINRIEREDKTIIVLCIQVYFSCLIYMLIFFVFIIQSALGDIYQKEFDSSYCVLLGYVYAAILCVLYLSFINQGLFRLCRIVYSHNRYLQSSWFYIILFVIEVIGAFILLCPAYVLGDIIYLPDDHFCFVPISNIRGYFWIFFSVFSIPVLSLSVIYLRITMFIRKQSIQTVRNRRRQIRDMNAIRSIFLIVGFLLLLGLPTAILIIMMFITGEAHPLTFRITCVSIGTSMAGLSVAVISSVPRLRIMIWNTFEKKLMPS